MYNNYISRKEAGEIRRELKAYKIACGILAIILVFLVCFIIRNHKEQQEEIYSLMNGCTWEYKTNGFKICK